MPHTKTSTPPTAAAKMIQARKLRTQDISSLRVQYLFPVVKCKSRNLFLVHSLIHSSDI